jgi:transposase InsO family protein
MPPKRAPALTPAEALVKRIWNDPSSGFAGAPQTLRRARAQAAAEGIPFALTVKDVRKLLTGYEAVQLNAPRRRVKDWAHFKASRVNESHQADLLDFDKAGFGVASPSPKSPGAPGERGMRYLFVVVDVYSRLAVGVLLPDKRAATVLAGWLAILALRPYGGPAFVPERLAADSGTEFNDVARECLRRGIPFTKEDPEVHTRLAVANRKHGIIEKRLALATRTLAGAKFGDWEPLVAPILNNINTSVTSAHGQTPADVYSGKEEPEWPEEKAVDAAEVAVQAAIKLGDRVRIRTDFNTGVNRDRIYSERWSDEVYVVVSTVETAASGLVRFRLWDPESMAVLKNSFYARELQVSKRAN